MITAQQSFYYSTLVVLVGTVILKPCKTNYIPVKHTLHSSKTMLNLVAHTLPCWDHIWIPLLLLVGSKFGCSCTPSLIVGSKLDCLHSLLLGQNSATHAPCSSLLDSNWIVHASCHQVQIWLLPLLGVGSEFGCLHSTSLVIGFKLDCMHSLLLHQIAFSHVFSSPVC